MYLLTQSSAILTRDHRGSQPGRAHAPVARPGQGSGRGFGGSGPTRLLRVCPARPMALSPLLPPTDILGARRSRQVQEFAQQMQKSWEEQGSKGCPAWLAQEALIRSLTPLYQVCPGEAAKGQGWEAGGRGVWARCLLCPPGSSGPAWPPFHRGRELLLIAYPTCELRTALKAQIILTTVPHSSPVLFGKQPLSCCTKRGFSRSPAALGANLPAWNAGGSGRGVWVRVLCKHNARRSAVIELRRCWCQERRALCARCQLQLPLRVPAAVGLNPSHATAADWIPATSGWGHWG